MDENDHLTTHSAWRRFISGVLLIVLIVGSLLIFIQMRSHASGPHIPWSKSEVVTLTGYGRLSPMNPSSDPFSVVLTHSQVDALNDALAALVLTRSQALSLNRSEAVFQKVGASCHENSLVFTLAISPRQGDVHNWKATELECPAPGILFVQSLSGIQTYRGPVCPLNSLVAQDLPPGSAKGTRSFFKYCSSKN
jgi:hypothetical protein